MATPSTPCRKRGAPRPEETPKKADGQRRNAWMADRVEPEEKCMSDVEKPEPLAIVSDGEQLEVTFGGTRYRVLDKDSFKELIKKSSSRRRMTTEEFCRAQKAATASSAEAQGKDSQSGEESLQHLARQQNFEEKTAARPGSDTESPQERARRILKLLSNADASECLGKAD
mmetsp:Transcript_44573/g.81383  ORF Transcript_44573/g.81383 Transcript_44573/m.81383 type:complete len:171 (+) Transcript_44573:70-582(+)